MCFNLCRLQKESDVDVFLMVILCVLFLLAVLGILYLEHLFKYHRKQPVSLQTKQEYVRKIRLKNYIDSSKLD